jgi:protein-L-isoaspartate(D-aspartate) O-methyltransferase
MIPFKKITGALIIPAILAGIPLGCTAASDADTSYAKARQEMIQTQLKPRGIDDERVLKAFEKVERHRFVDKKYLLYAYGDHPLPIGEDQTISQPYIVAVMTQLLKLDENDRVLEVGTGSGYQAAILAELAKEVYTIEIIDTLARTARERLKSLGYENIIVRTGDGYQGWPEKAPFDAVIVTCAPPEIPQPLIDQLAEGGRMIIPVGIAWQELILLERKNGEVTETRVLPVRFVPMTGEGVEQK